MRSLWSNRDAEAMVAHYAEAGVEPRPGAARLHLAPARRRPASWCCTAAATPRSRPMATDLLGDRPRCCASRAAAGTWRRSSRPGCRRCGWRRCAAARARRAHRRGHGPHPARQPARSRRAQPVGRDAAARLPAAQVHRPHARDRGAEPRRPARRRGALRRALRRAARASCPTSCRASCSRRRRRRSSRTTRRSRGWCC